MNNIFLTNIVLLCFDYRYRRSVCLSQVPCVQLAADAVNSSFESFSSGFMKIKFYRCESPLTKNRLWTIIKFKRTDVVIKAILAWICPTSFNNDLRSKMHQFARIFLKNFPAPPCWGGENPSTPSVSRFAAFGDTCSTPSAPLSPLAPHVPLSKPFRRPWPTHRPNRPRGGVKVGSRIARRLAGSFRN